MIKKIISLFILLSSIAFSNNLDYATEIEKTYLNEDILKVQRYKFNDIKFINDVYKEDEMFYISGNNFSGSFRIDNTLDKIVDEKKIENFDYNFRSIDKIDGKISLLDNKRRMIVQKSFKMYIDYKLEDIAGFSYDGERIWIYDSKEKKVFLFQRNKEKLDAVSCINYNNKFKIKGIRIKENKELWACSRDKIFIFDEYFKFRHVYDLNENISGFCFSDEEDTKDTVTVYASSEKKNELYRYKLKRY